MLFPTIDFAIFFAVVFTVNWLLNPYPGPWKIFMVAASYFFYAWADWRFIFLLAASTMIAYTGAGILDRLEGEAKRLALWVTLTLLLGLLAWFKYYVFFTVNVDNLFHFIGFGRPLPLLNVSLPVAISFFTFMASSYVVDVYRGTLKTARPDSHQLHRSILVDRRRAGQEGGPVLLFGHLRGRPGLRLPASALRAGGHLRGVGLRRTDLRGLQWIHRHRHRGRPAARIPLSPELQPPLYRRLPPGFLAQMAYDAVQLASGLPLHTVGGKPRSGVEDFGQHPHHHASRGSLAWGGVDVHRMGPVPRSRSGHRPPTASVAKGPRAQPRARWPGTHCRGPFRDVPVGVHRVVFFSSHIVLQCLVDGGPALPQLGNVPVGDPLGRAGYRHRHCHPVHARRMGRLDKESLCRAASGRSGRHTGHGASGHHDVGTPGRRPVHLLPVLR